jgi:NAD(P)H dehydrogenase (quinone)
LETKEYFEFYYKRKQIYYPTNFIDFLIFLPPKLFYMNTLVVIAHPNPASFNKNGILATVKATLADKGSEVRVRDLYEINFNPVLSGKDIEGIQSGNLPADIKEEQEHLTWANNIIVIAPVWWIGRPAILQGYFDKVLTNGFAFKYGPEGPVGLLQIEKALLINTAGTPEPVYDGWAGSKELLSRPTTEGVFYFTGIKQVQHVPLYGIGFSTPEQREAMLAQVAEVVKGL